MRTLVSVASWLLILGLLASVPAVAQDWRGKARVDGVVTDADGSPVEGATVTLTVNGSGPEALQTSKKGRWSFLGLVGGNWTVSVEKKGYQSTESKVLLQQYGEASRQSVQSKLLKEEEALATTEEGQATLEIRGKLEQAKASLAAKDFGTGRAMIEEVLPLLDDGAKIPWLVLIAKTYYEEGHPEKAIEGLKRALANSPDDVEALQLISSFLVDAGRADEAEAYIARLPEGEKKIDPNALLNQGIASYNAGDLEPALASFNEVVAVYPDLADAYYYRGLVNLNLGKNAEALADFEKMLVLQPDHPNAGEAKQFVDYLKTQ